MGWNPFKGFKKRPSPELEGLVAYYAKAYAEGNWDDLDEINSLPGDASFAMNAIVAAVFSGNEPEYHGAVNEAFYRSSKATRDPASLAARVLKAGFKTWPALDKAVATQARRKALYGQK